MAWIESHQDLGQHPKTFALMVAIHTDLLTAVGVLHMLWHFTLKFAWRTGDLTKFADEVIAQGIGWQKEPGVLIKGLQESGWLDGKQVHDWMDYAGKIVNDRIYNEERRITASNAVPHRKIGATVPDLTVPNLTKKTPNIRKVDVPYQKPDPTKDPVGHLVMVYKIVKGYPYDDRVFDQKWGRWAKAAKQLLDDCGSLEASQRFIEKFADLSRHKDLEWTLNTICNKAHELKVQGGKSERYSGNERISHSNDEAGTDQTNAGARGLAPGNTILARMSDRGGLQDHDGNRQ